MLNASSSKILISDKEDATNIFEAMRNPQIKLDQPLILCHASYKNIHSSSKKALVNYTSQSIQLDESHLNGLIELNQKTTQMQLHFQKAIIQKLKAPFLKASNNKLILDTLKISGDELVYDHHFLNMTHNIIIEMDQGDQGVQILKASHMSLNPDKKIIVLSGSLHHPIIIENKLKNCTMITKNMLIDFSNGIKQACIKCDSTVSFNSNPYKDKPLKHYFQHDPSSS